jgi:GTP pyrophosphokinase
MKLSNKYSKALAFTNALHEGHVRKGGNKVPYMSHLMAVSALVLEYGGNEDEAIAALLHDAIEDQGPEFKGGSDGLREEIRKRFGKEVLAVVEECTDADTMTKPPWKERKLAYIDHLESASKGGLLVSNADKVHNASSILRDHKKKGDAIYDIFDMDREDQDRELKKRETLWYYNELQKSYANNTNGNQDLATRLGEIISELELRKDAGQ